MKKFLSAAAMALTTGMVFAEGGTTIVDTTTAATAVNQLKTDLSGWVTTVTPYILGIVGAFLVFWLIKFAIRLVKGFVGSSK